MTDKTKAPERIWAVSGYGRWQDKPPASELRTGQWTEYTRKDLSDAKIAELEANINIKADWIEATINDMAAQDQELHEMKARAEAAEAKMAKAVELLEWQTRLVDNNITPNNETIHRINIAGTWYTGPVVDWTHSVLTSWKKINRATLAELKGTDQ